MTSSATNQATTPAPHPDTDPAKFVAVRTGLLAWFDTNRRDLPWRHSRDPYAILVSEVMLQQTQVDRVIPYFRAFLDRFPTVHALAAAPVAEVIKAWAGLGYNRRAVNLQRTAQHVVAVLGGEFPRDVESLRRLPGVGPYTAGAIACFAFEQDVGFVDTNIRRVLHRLFVGVDVPQPTASDRHIQRLAAEAVPPGDGWRWNQALMEFGALQCTARRPACVICPLQAACCAFPAIQGAIQEIPRGVRLKREAPFDGSNRYYRGRVLAALRDLPPDTDGAIDLRTLGARVRADFTDADVPWLYGVVLGLTKDGLAMAAEDSPTYDAGSPDPPDPATAHGGLKIKLP